MSLTNEDINNKIIRLWKDEKKDEKKARAPHLYSDFIKNGILFIGLNPSKLNIYKIKKPLEEKYKDQAKTILKELKHRPKYLKDLLKADIPKIAKMTQIIKDVHPYFAKCRDISDRTHTIWEHIDLFSEIETEQEKIKKNYFEKKEKNSDMIKLKPFAEKQFEINIQAIEAIEPKVIVVINALASKIIEQYYDDKNKLSKFDVDKGFHTVKLNNITIPIFFSSMLTGQRALDDGSYERLVWQIGSALKNI